MSSDDPSARNATEKDTKLNGRLALSGILNTLSSLHLAERIEVRASDASAPGNGTIYTIAASLPTRTVGRRPNDVALIIDVGSRVRLTGDLRTYQHGTAATVHALAEFTDAPAWLLEAAKTNGYLNKWLTASVVTARGFIQNKRIVFQEAVLE